VSDAALPSGTAGPRQQARRSLGVAIIGSGLMAKAHTMAWRNLQAVFGSLPACIRLVVLADATDEFASAGAAQFGYERWTTSWQDAVADPAVDVVDIVTPNFLHKDVALAAARAGKHIWCEKPLALTARDALEMTEAAEQAGVKTLVGFSYLRNPGVALARQLVERGEIGRPVSFTGTFAIDAMADPGTPFTWRQDRSLSGAGALGDLGAHVIALARHLAGPIRQVAALSSITVPSRPLPAGAFGYGEKADEGAPWREVENDDVTMFLAAFGNGAVGTVEASRVSAGRSYDVGFTLTGTNGAIRFSQQSMHELQVRLASDPGGSTGFRHVQLGPGNGDYGALWPVPGVNISIHDLKFFEARDLVAAIVSGGPAWPDFREGWEVEKVIGAIDEAARKHSWVTIP
jgi:predicted dehydrogenase